MSWISNKHNDVPWCVAGPVVILYHASINVSIGVQYDERTVFGSHGAYAVWTGTSPRAFNVSTTMVAANADEVKFNLGQVAAAHNWTQESPPTCLPLVSPINHDGVNHLANGMQTNDMVRIEGYDSSVEEATHLDAGSPIQISLGLTLKECKPI